MTVRCLLLILHSFSCCLFASAPPAYSQESIKIITNNWTSQIVLSQITGNIFETMGFDVNYIPSSTSDQWGALAHGAADVQVEIWEGTMSDQFNRLVAAGSIIDAGSHKATTREDWWYPKYVEALCPGLPDWQALKACSSLFQRPDSNGIGVYFSGPWEKPDEARVRALEMDFKVHTLSKGDDLWAELKKAYSTKTPIILFNWTPNWIESRYQGAFIEFPQYSPSCETDLSWGVNKKFLYDCGNPKGGWLKKAATNSFKQQYPCAYKTLKNINLNNQQISFLSALVDIDQMSFQAAAIHWQNSNSSLWESWIPQECRK